MNTKENHSINLQNPSDVCNIINMLVHVQISSSRLRSWKTRNENIKQKPLDFDITIR